MDKEKIIKQIREILEKEIEFHSCNDENCKFEEYCDIANHKLTDDFWDWVRKNKEKMLKKNQKKINKLLENYFNNNDKIYNIWKKIIELYSVDSCQKEIEELIDFISNKL